MKIWMLTIALFTTAILFAQPGEHFLSYRDGFKTEGYLDGQRLDTIAAQYATIGWTGTGHVWLDYGQYRDGKKEMTVRDWEGSALLFEGNNMPFVLNFLYHNGWEVQQIVSNVGSGIANRDTYLLRKRRL